MLRAVLGIAESDTPEAIEERLGGRRILGLAFGLDVAAEVHPLVARERFHSACVELLEESAAERGGVVVIEDVHWAETPLLDLVDDVRQRVHAQLLVVATARPEAREAVRAATELVLPPLSAEQSAEMLAELLGGDLPPQARELVVQRAEGNPFFIEELVSTLIDRGLLVRRDGRWEMPDGADLDLPDSIQAVLAARVDLLEPRAKEALQAASVVGRTFWAGTIQELTGAGARELDLLRRRDFVHRCARSSIAGETEYVFKHQLTREVAYSSLLKMERARLHAALAERFEHAAQADVRAALVAHHYEQAVRDDYADLAWADDADILARLRQKAVFWLRRASEGAVSRYEMEDALSMLGRALELSEEDATRFQLWRALAAAHALRYDAEGLVSASERAVELAQDERARARVYADLALRGAVAELMWNPPLRGGVVEEWIARALEMAPVDSAERAKALVARASHDQNAADPAREALAIAESLGDQWLVGLGLWACALAATSEGWHEAASAYANRLLGVIEAIKDPGLNEILMAGPLRVAMALGRFDDARGCADQLDEFARELTAHHRLHGIAVVVEVEELAGTWETIRVLERRVEEAVERNLDTPCARNARSLLVCALAREALGDPERARQLEQAAEALHMEGHERLLASPRIRLALLRGDLADAERLLGRYGAPRVRIMGELAGAAAWLDASAALGRRASIEEEAPALAQPGTYIEPFVLRALGRVREDEALIERALARFEAMELDWHAEQTRMVLA